MKEVELSIKSLFFYILRHWKSIVVAMLIGATVICGMQMVRIAGKIQNEQTTVDVTASLSETERDYIESVYDYLNAMRELNESRRDSLIMNLDSDNVVKSELTYMISVNDPNNMEGVEQAFRNYIIGSGFIGYISDKTDMKNDDVAEIVTISDGTGRQTALDSVLTIGIVSNDISSVEAISKAVQAYIAEKSAELLQNGFEHELQEIGNSTYQENDMDILNLQVKYLQEIQARNRIILDTENAITGAQKEYYERLMDGGDTETPSDDSTDNYVKTPIRPSVKYIVLGLIAGAFVMCGIHFLIFIFANRLDEEDDIEGLFGTYLIGTITGKNQGNLIFILQHLGKRTFDFEESIKLISTRIRMAVQKDGISKIGLLGCGIKKNNENAANAIIDTLKKYGIEAVLIDEPIYDPASAEKLSEVDRVVLFEKAGVTYRTEIWKEMEMIKKLGIKAEGLIIVE